MCGSGLRADRGGSPSERDHPPHRVGVWRRDFQVGRGPPRRPGPQVTGHGTTEIVPAAGSIRGGELPHEQRAGDTSDAPGELADVDVAAVKRRLRHPVKPME